MTTPVDKLVAELRIWGPNNQKCTAKEVSRWFNVSLVTAQAALTRMVRTKEVSTRRSFAPREDVVVKNYTFHYRPATYRVPTVS